MKDNNFEIPSISLCRVCGEFKKTHIEARKQGYRLCKQHYKELSITRYSHRTQQSISKTIKKGAK